jgi:hypothetical protein
VSRLTGYSDRIDHALAFAAKHHDRQVHRGVRAPYRTQAATVGIILTRYGQPEQTVVAGILYDVVADAVLDRQSRVAIDERVARKFGAETVSLLLSAIPGVVDDQGVELSHDERREELLRRLESAPPAARWVSAANALYELCSTVASLRRTIDPDTVWNALPLGRDGTLRWYRQLEQRLVELGFTAPIVDELREALSELATLAARPVSDT